MPKHDEPVAGTTFAPLADMLAGSREESPWKGPPVGRAWADLSVGVTASSGGSGHKPPIDLSSTGPAPAKPQPTPVKSARDIATRAASLVGGDRERDHGKKADNFNRIAKMWQTYLDIRRHPSAPLDAVDVGHMMSIMKVARTQSGALNVDDYVDGAGYMACAGEVAIANESWTGNTH